MDNPSEQSGRTPQLKREGNTSTNVIIAIIIVCCLAFMYYSIINVGINGAPIVTRVNEVAPVVCADLKCENVLNYKNVYGAYSIGSVDNYNKVDGATCDIAYNFAGITGRDRRRFQMVMDTTTCEWKAVSVGDQGSGVTALPNCKLTPLHIGNYNFKDLYARLRGGTVTLDEVTANKLVTENTCDIAFRTTNVSTGARGAESRRVAMAQDPFTCSWSAASFGADGSGTTTPAPCSFLACDNTNSGTIQSNYNTTLEPGHTFGSILDIHKVDDTHCDVAVRDTRMGMDRRRVTMALDPSTCAWVAVATAAAGTGVTAKLPCRALACTPDLNYRDKYSSAWSGAYRMTNVVNLNKVDDANCDVAYNFAGGYSGEDKRRFHMALNPDTCVWTADGMGAQGSGVTVPDACAPLVCDPALKDTLTKKYSDAWTGAYSLSGITNMHRVDDSTCDVAYTYTGSSTGTDKRRFTLAQDLGTCSWTATGMGAQGSGSTA